MADFVNPIIRAVVESLLVPIKKNISYLVSYKKYVSDMHTKMVELVHTRADVEKRMDRNKNNRFNIPSNVPTWLHKVDNIVAQEKQIPNDVGFCFNLKVRYELGRKAFNINQVIDSLMAEKSRITWDDHRIPLAKVDSINTSTSTTSSDHSDFKSREFTFKEALKALEPNHKSHMIALCGMGGVGKTTMMEKLKKVVEERKIFDMIVPLVIGEKMNTTFVQDSIADYLGTKLEEKSVQARADMLRKSFENLSKDGKNKILVIIDDVWEFIDLKVFGLSPLPNQGVGFKLLLTSRNSNVCSVMGVEANSIFNVGILTDSESQSLFHRFVKSPDDDLTLDLCKIGYDIVRKCQGLPIAIKTIACTLKHKEKHVWEDALTRLQHYDIHKDVKKVFEVSYNNLQDNETKSVLLLCGLYPEDYDIPLEELVRYGWGLHLFNKVDTIRETRNRLGYYIDQLVSTNLLIESDSVGWVKMHDLIRAFVLDMLSRVEDAKSIVNHDNISNWPKNNMSESCKRISLTCTGMSEFPSDFKYPNLLLLNLRQGDKSLRFPQDFYGEMKKLEVIAFEKFAYPLLPNYGANLRMLSLHNCRLMFDLSSIGNLLNLEILSFANSNIRKLPYKIGNLKKLKVLDLTGSSGLLIDKGVLKNLVNLEELYMRVNKTKLNAVSFTYDNYNELVERSKNLSTLEIEFSEYNGQLKNMSYVKLERFKISVGCLLEKENINMHSYENTLMLNTKKGELLESKMYELFEKTKVLHLKGNGMNDLEDIDVKVKVKFFYNIRVLNISQCAQFIFLFTCQLARTLSKLEHLEISYCDNMEEIIHFEESGEKSITFPRLKVLSLNRLPKLSGFCNNAKVELPKLVELILEGLPNFTSIYQETMLATSSNPSYTSEIRPFFNQEVGVIPNKLEKLHLSYMENLKEIWPCQFGCSEEANVSMLREIRVRNCDSLVNLFPTNPMPFLCNLKDLTVEVCGSIEVLFNIDLECAVKVEQVRSSLRNIYLQKLDKLEVLWRIKSSNNSNILFCCFQAVELINIHECRSFRNIFTPTTVNFDMGALTDWDIRDCGQIGRNNELVKIGQKQQLNAISSKEEIYEVGDNISNVAFPFYLIHNFLSLRQLGLSWIKGMEVVFDIKSSRSSKLVTPQTCRQALLLSSVEEISLVRMESMSHVWKCNWKEFLIIKGQQPEYSFHNLTRIYLFDCNKIKYLFSPFMAILLSNIKTIEIRYCDGMEEVISNKDDEDDEMATSISTHTNTILFPNLDSLILADLRNLKHIGGGGAKGESKEFSVSNTTTTSIEGQVQFSQVGVASWSLCQYSRRITLVRCHALSTAVPSYAVGQMQKLEELEVNNCNSMMEVFETRGIKNSGSCIINAIDTTPAIPRPRNISMLKLSGLKILKVERCDLLEYIFPFSALESLNQLERLSIKYCKAMKVIVKEEYEDQIKASNFLVFPRLKRIELEYLENLEGFFLGMNIDFQYPLQERVVTEKHGFKVDGINYLEDVDVKVKVKVKSFYNLKDITICACHQLRYLFTCHLETTLSNLEHLNISACRNMEALIHFENTGEKTISFPELKFLTLENLPKLSGFCNNVYVTELPELITLRLINLPYFTSIYPKNKLTTSSMPIYSSEIQPFLNRAVGVIPKLENMFLLDMENLKEIWPSEFNNSEEVNVSTLRNIEVRSCDSLVNLFPTNPMPFLRHLEDLEVYSCGSIEVLFNIDLGCVVKYEQVTSSFRNITATSLKSLKEVWRIKGAVMNIDNQKQKTSRQPLLLASSLEKISLSEMESMSHVWKCNWNELLILHGQQLESSFSNLSSIQMEWCKIIKYLFSPLMAKLLSNLKEIRIKKCDGIEEVVSNRDDEDEEMTTSISSHPSTTRLFPRLDLLNLSRLENLKHIGGRFKARNNDLAFKHTINSIQDQSQLSQVDDVSWSLCQYSRTVSISSCHTFSSVVPSYAIGQMQKLEELEVASCNSMTEVFETQGINNSDYCDTDVIDTTLAIPRPQKITLLKLPNLKKLSIYNCNLLEYIFPFSTLKSLSQLEWLSITLCKTMQVIVKEESGEQIKASNSVVFSRLKSIRLENLPNLVGFFRGTNVDFQWPLLERVTTEGCPKLMGFTSAQSAPNLN